ncbi:MAG TPA: hypothetical protein VGN89_14830 [Phenylobacterium sp.]|nr:hypothetical protein [Phenylobacterium sp.]
MVALLLPLAASAAPAPSPAAASHLADATSLMLSPGERVTVRLGPSGGLTLVSVVPEDVTHALPPKPGRVNPPNAGNPLVEAPEGTVSFLAGPMGDGAVMKVENGTSKAFDYQAVLLAGPDAAPVREPTGVCTVLPLLPSWETWPKRQVNAILLSHFTPRDTNQVVCQEARKAPAASPHIAGGTPTNN